MAASFANVRLGVMPDDYQDWIEKFHSLSDFRFSDLWRVSGYDLGHLPLSPTPDESRVEVGTLYWPTGLTRCGFGHFIVDSVGLEAIQTALGTTSGPADLVLSDGTGGTRTFPMYFLCARPLSQITGQTGAYLLTLVDRRYFLRTRTGSITSTSTWSSLLSALASALGITLTAGSIDADYASPTDQWEFDEQPLSVVVDAVCNRIGHRVVANLDGTFKTVTADTALTDCAALTAALTKTAGGLLLSADLVRPVPASVKVVFRAESGTPHTVTKTLSGLSVTGYGAASGVSGQVVTLYGETVYTGSNGAALDTYATQAATDWYRWQLVNADLTYPGVCPWTPTGAEDRVEWKYFADRILTRVVRPPFQVPLPGSAILEVPDDTTFGCGLAVDEETHEVTVDVPGLLGDGLTFSDAGDCPVFEVATGCHLTIGGDGAVAVNTASLAGSGLKEDTSTPCKKLTLDFTPATSILFGSLPANGLVVIGGNAVGVNLGCGLEFVAGAVAVDNDALAGVAATTSLVTAGVCGLSVDLVDVTTDQYTADKITGYEYDCGTLKIKFDRRTLSLLSNAAGVVVGVDVGAAAQNSLDIDLCHAVQCCTATPLSVTGVADPDHLYLVGGEAAVDFAATPSGGVGPYTYRWAWGDGTADGSNSVSTHTFTTTGLKLVALTVTDSCGCTATTVVPVAVGEECGCEDCEVGQPDDEGLEFTMTGGTGDFAAVNGLWQLYNTGGCNYGWYQNGWEASTQVGLVSAPVGLVKKAVAADGGITSVGPFESWTGLGNVLDDGTCCSYLGDTDGCGGAGDSPDTSSGTGTRACIQGGTLEAVGTCQLCIPPVTVSCCTEPIPAVLNWTISSKTGDCVCAPTSGTVLYGTYGGVTGWGTVDFSCLLGECEENASYYLECLDGVGFRYGGIAPTSATCSPFSVSFTKTGIGVGDYVITFTAP